MINFEQETYQKILQSMLEQIPDVYDKRDTAPIPTALGPAAYALEGFYLTLDQVQKQAFIQTSAGESLDYLAAIGGLSRYAATKAVRLGVFDAPVLIGARFSTINGEDSINFTVTAEASGSNRYKLTADTAGTIGNEYTGPILPITAVFGLKSAQITDILVPGDDTETDDSLRERLIGALNERPFGGNISAYRTFVKSLDGVGSTQVYPTWDGGGTVKLSVLGADWLPASSELVETVQNAVDPPPGQGLGLGMAPIGAKVTVTAPTAVSVNVTATVTLSQGYEIGQVQQPVQEAVEAYLLMTRKAWDENTDTDGGVAYTANVYLARVTAAILSAAGVLNAVNVTINGTAEDLRLTETGTVQQVPVLGAVTLNAGT